MTNPNMIHVYPLDDLKPHKVEGGYDCECMPRIQKQENGALVIVHNAWDRREWDEEDHKYVTN